MRRIIALLLLPILLLTSCGAQGGTPDHGPIPAPDPEPSPAPSDPEPTPVSPDPGPEPAEDGPDPQPEPEPVSEPAQDAAAILARMTTVEKVGQLFLIRPESLDPGITPEQVNDTYHYGVTEVSSAMLSFLREHPAGGVVFFGKNLTDRAGLSAFLNALDGASATPMLYAIDEEGGPVSRAANTDTFGIEDIGPMGTIGTSGDPLRAEEAGRYIGTYLHELGFTLDFAPVADINTNPDNIVIGKRAFGDDPALVSGMVSSFLKGLHSASVAGSLKHFPGHGDTVGDTHTGTVMVTKTWEELLKAELIPFIDNFEQADMIMVAHLSLPNITSDGLPASLSQELITGKLRGELGYTGLVITDALAMGAVAENYPAGEAAVLAFEAGADLLLMPWDYEAAFSAVLDAVNSGAISQERLDESVLRILQLKERLGLLQN